MEGLIAEGGGGSERGKYVGIILSVNVLVVLLILAVLLRKKFN
jgi:hypothetical protein